MANSANPVLAVANQPLRGRDTGEIWAGLAIAIFLKDQPNASIIPIDHPDVQRIVWEINALSRNAAVDNSTEPMTPLKDLSSRISNSLAALEKIPEGKPSVPTFTKELDKHKSDLKVLEEKREQLTSLLAEFIKDRNGVVSNILLRLLQVLENNPDQKATISVIGNQDIANELERISKSRQTLLFEIEKLTRSKTVLRTSLLHLLSKAEERLPAEKRLGPPAPLLDEKPTPP